MSERVWDEEQSGDSFWKELQADAEIEYNMERDAVYDARIASLAQWGKPVWTDREVLPDCLIMGDLEFDFHDDGEDSPVRFECYGYAAWSSDYMEHFGQGDISEDDIASRSDEEAFKSSLVDLAKRYADENGLDTGVKKRPLPGDEPYDGLEPSEAEHVLWYMRKDSYADPKAVESAVNTNGILRAYQGTSRGSAYVEPFSHEDVMDILKSDYAESDFVPYVDMMKDIKGMESDVSWRKRSDPDAARKLMDTMSDLSKEARKKYEHIRDLIHEGNGNGDGDGDGLPAAEYVPDFAENRAEKRAEEEAGEREKARKQLEEDRRIAFERERKAYEARLEEERKRLLEEQDDGKPRRRIPDITFPEITDPDGPEFGL